MNGIVAVCHFCNEHSASVVLCTMPINEPKSENANSCSQSTTPTWKPRNDPEYLVNQLSSFNSIFGIKSDQKTPAINVPQCCRACNAFTNGEPGLVSHDTSQEVTYVSVNYPLNSAVYNALHKASVQSLSEMSDNSGPSYFSDENCRIHVFSYGFYLQDSEARGLKSRFSILVLSPDKLFLFNIWPFLDLNIGNIVTRLQTAASETFDRESRQVLSTSSGGSNTASSSRASSAQRVHQRTFTPPPTGTSGYVNKSENGSLSAEARNMKHKRNFEPRSITELTKIDQLFYRFHSWFTWLLRAANRRWNVFPQTISPPQLEDALFISEQMVDATSVIDQNFSPFESCPTGTSPTSAVLKPSESQLLAYFLLRRVQESLGNLHFTRLLQNLLIGNQIIIDSNNSKFGKLTLLALTMMIPRGCVKKVTVFSDVLPLPSASLILLKHYQNSNRTTQIPFLNHPMLVLRLIVTEDSQTQQKHEFDSLLSESISKIDFTVLYNNYIPQPDNSQNAPIFRRTSQGELYEPASEALNTSDLLISTESSSAVLSSNPPYEIEISFIVNQFCGILNAKPQLEPCVLHSAFLTVKEEWLSKARLVYSFEKCQSELLKSFDYKKKLSQIYESINCSSQQDEAVIQFFIKGFSHYTLKNPCHIRKSRSSLMSRRTSYNSSGGNSFIGDSATTIAAMQTFCSHGE